MKFLKGFVRRFATAFSIASILFVGAVYATTIFPTGTTGESVGSVVMAWINGSGNAVPVSATNPLPVTPSNTSAAPLNVLPPVPAVVVSGQVVIAVTGTRVQLATNTLLNGVVVKAKSSNAAACGTVGGSAVTNTYDGTGNGYGLCPGDTSSFAVPNSNLLYVNGTAGDIFTFEGN